MSTSGIDKSKESQCSELINKELRRAVKHGIITHREAEAFQQTVLFT